MDKAIIEYRKRRQKRLDARFGEEPFFDSVEEYRKRRQKRLDMRGEWNENDHPRAKNGQFTSGSGGGGVSGGDKQFHHDPKDGGGGSGSGGWEQRAKKVKGIKVEKGDMGFGVPVFDAETFTDNIEEKKGIAREAAKSLIPAVKKSLSTEVRDIKRPKVDDSTRKYLKEQVVGVTDEQIDRALKAADKIYRYWEENEPAITEKVVGAVKGVGGSMFGLDNRRKFDKSLAKKAAADALDKNQKFNGNIELAAAGIKDGARYTAVFDNDSLADGYKKVKDALEEMGIREYRCKNFWKQYRDQDGSDGKNIGEQKSIQCVFETPDGQRFELQFHTPESMAAKEVNHPTYKQKKEPPEEHREYNAKRSWFMRDTSSVVPDPKGVFDIEEHKRGETGYK